MTRPRTARRALVAGLATLALGLAACGDDDGGGADVTSEAPVGTGDTAPSGTTDTTATAETTVTRQTLAVDDVDLEAYAAEAASRLDFEDEDAAACVASGVIAAIGAERIAGTGLDPDAFFDTSSFAATGIEVTDELRAEMEAEVATCDGLVEELVNTEFGDDAEVAACVSGVLDDSIVANWLISGLTQGEASDAAIAAQEAARACVAPPSTTTGS